MSTLDEMQRLLRSGRLAEAGKAGQAVLERSPDDVEALNVVALAALRGGTPGQAVDLLQRATHLQPENPISFHYLGRAHEAAGDLQAAVSAVSQALRLKPDFYLSRLHYAALLERTGDKERSGLQFARAVRDAQASGAWLDAERTPAGLRPLVEHAVAVIRTRRREILARLTDNLAAAHGRDAMQRVEKCLRIYLGEEPAAFPDPRQQPSFLYFPDLPTSPYFDRQLLPWVTGLEARTDDIRQELLGLLPSDQGRERVFTADDVEQQNLRGAHGAPSWNGYYFYRHGDRRDANCEACPITAAELDRLPLSRVRGHGPEVLFSVFTAGTHLLPHRGVTNTRSVCHLPLIVPADCALNVGGELHEWKEGRVVAFDDTYEHEAWNRSDEIRVVLIFDIWNPHLTDAERAAVTEIVATIGDDRTALDEASPG